MATVAEKVKTALLERFSEQELLLEPEGEGEAGKVLGLIVSSRFEGLDDEQRQDLIWDLLRGRLDAREQTRITALLTLTPEEHDQD
jgi:acid stress-induced BolA-like protein IbaG/YrbA